MAVPTVITDCNPTLASNSPAGTDSVGTNMDDYFRAAYGFIAQLLAATQSNAYTAFTTAGTDTAFTLTPSPAITALAANQRFRVNFNAASGATPTLAVSGLTAKNLKYKGTGGAKAAITAVQVPSGWISDVEYDGTDWVVLNPAALPGTLLQRVEATPYTTYSSDALGTLPMDDTIPQKTEGASYVSLSITPKFSTSRLVIRGEAYVGGNGANTVGAFIVDTAINDALAANSATLGGANYMAVIPIYVEISAASTAARTYQLRLGAGAGITFFVNGNSAARFFGGVGGCRLSCEEIAA